MIRILLFILLWQSVQGTDPNAAIRAQLAALKLRIAATAALGPGKQRLIPDAEWYAKGVEWGLRYDTLADQDRTLMERALKRGAERIEEIASNRSPWDGKRGRVARAYRSTVDGSVQPYGLIIPRSYDPGKPMRLDVVLHGSTRPVGMSELRYVMPFDEGDTGGAAPDDRDYIELYPLGRVENCYRWAGETDVFEAIEDVCRHYNVDRKRIVLRGMSMGASGTWHLGLKHPDFFVALGPYCGYVDTHRFSETPGMNFVKVGPLPWYQELGLHMLDSVDYAANAGVVPVVAAIGEKDPFFQAHVIMGEAFKKEGIPFVNLISPGTAHVQDPKTWAEQMRRIGEHATNSLDQHFHHIRFVTWTLKYYRCHWLDVQGLAHQYRRSEIVADRRDDGTIEVQEPTNIARFAVMTVAPSETLHRPLRTVVKIGGKTIPLPARADQSRVLSFEKVSGKWRFAGSDMPRYRCVPRSGKRPGIQGPIDDAFTSKFLCVRPTGKPWNPSVNAWAEANLRRFQYEFARYFRGDVPVKDDTAVTADDKRTCNLILFGDPGSNRLIREAMPKLPVRWTTKALVMGAARYSSVDYAPAFIAPSPFSGTHYVVINSGHTFHEAELNRLNYLLFPRLGDWAVMKIGTGVPSSPSDLLPEEVVTAGYFDEQWRFPKDRSEDGRSR